MTTQQLPRFNQMRPRSVWGILSLSMATASLLANALAQTPPSLEGIINPVTVAPQPAASQPAATKPAVPQPAAPEQAVASVSPRLAEMLKSPHATMITFLRAVEEQNVDQAALCLDLSELSATMATEKRKTYVFQLKEVIDRMLWLGEETFAAGADLSRPFSLAEETFDLTGKDLEDARGIVIAKSADGLWRFSPETLELLDGGLWLRWHLRDPVSLNYKTDTGAQKQAKMPFSLWLSTLFPEKLTRQQFLIPDYQWICLLLLIFIGFIVDWITRALLNRITHIWVHYQKSGHGLKQMENPWKPVGLLSQALVWYYGTAAIGFPASVLEILFVGLKLFAVVSAVWTAFLFINLFSVYLHEKAKKTGTKYDDLLVPLVSRSLKFFVACMGIITGAKAFNLPIHGLIGGLGLGGAALALASKDAISNLFGSLTVLTDRPFEVGDWVVTDKAEGSVESVGFRSTRIRTFYNSQITIPNSILTTSMVDNMGRRHFRRIKTTLGVQYDTTPEQMDAFCEGIRELIRRHPYTRKDYYHVYFNQFGASSLDILLYCFLQCPDWSVELRERHRLFLDILQLARKLGVQFAFPTSTLHMFSAEPPADAETIDDPFATGRRQAAAIAGPILRGDDRPGQVEFRGPHQVKGD
jgi:MscS family membrane protein